MYQYRYKTPKEFSDMVMYSDGEFLIGLDFVKNDSEVIKDSDDISVFKETIKWLDLYFKGIVPDFIPKCKINNLTPFREDVINIMKEIPYGKVLTYNDIAVQIANNRGIIKMSSQAVGGAVGWNPICIIIPCHRVVGKGGNLTGYGGGINNKIALLKHENINMEKYFIPKK